MRTLEFVKPRVHDEQPRRGRGATVSTERRYRYPAEEVWEVSDDRWQVPDAPFKREKAADAGLTS
jgi:hypothetical protein